MPFQLKLSSRGVAVAASRSVQGDNFPVFFATTLLPPEAEATAEEATPCRFPNGRIIRTIGAKGIRLVEGRGAGGLSTSFGDGSSLACGASCAPTCDALCPFSLCPPGVSMERISLGAKAGLAKRRGSLWRDPRPLGV
jgi:hypothetical protein